MGKLKEILKKVKDFIEKLSSKTKKIIITAFIILVDCSAHTLPLCSFLFS